MCVHLFVSSRFFILTGVLYSIWGKPRRLARCGAFSLKAGGKREGEIDREIDREVDRLID